ncbi:hypothetical protein EIP91_001113 [Steccherinum ochraceum]|uniref:Methyltransferase domain-containing protein n=1 Tax=Steccherinum ochraceum TaxID=92696 RepID=A0A4R0RV64_9APHY|nr:hypothetical protein EIP91_001113 [Steccherinum ochraceum]
MDVLYLTPPSSLDIIISASLLTIPQVLHVLNSRQRIHASTMLAPYPYRLRSNSSPPRPRPSNPDASPRTPATKSHAASPDLSRSPLVPVPVPSPRSSPQIREESPSIPKDEPLAFFPSPSQPRKFFRLKRPSSSSSALRPTYERELLGPSLSSNRDGPLAPPRPPRNPARAAASPRPQTSSGAISIEGKKQASLLQSRSPLMRSFLPTDPLAFPLSLPPDPRSQQIQRRNSRRKTVPPPTQPSISEDPPTHGLQFSTADRTILEELKQKIMAKDAQFVLRNRKKHHPYHATEVPYPTCYDRRVLDNDIWETKSFQEACGSVTWHTFDEPPQRVLDLGCGAGTWILDCARAWKVRYQISLSDNTPNRLCAFLAGYVICCHVKRIARGVPEDKWDVLFEELARILKPGGALEIIEEDLYFPGSLRKSNPGHSSTYATNLSPEPPQISDRPRAPTPLSSFYSQAMNGSSTAANSSTPELPQRPPMAPRSHTEPLMPLPSRSPTDYTDATLVVEAEEYPPARNSDQQRRAVAGEAPVDPRDHSILEFVYNEMHAARFINLEPLSLLGNTLSLYFKDMRTHPPVIASFPPLPSSDTRSNRSRLTSYNGEFRSGPAPSHKSTISDPTVPAAHLLPPPSGVTTPERRPSITADALRTGKSQFLTLDDSRLDAFSPSPRASFPSPMQKSPNMSRIRRQSTDALGRSEPGSPVSPTNDQVAFPSLSDKRKTSRLPNPKFDFDVGLLNLHLLLRTEEILGCAEAMWDYVLDYQHLHDPMRTIRPTNTRPRSLVHPKMPRRPTADPMHGSLMALSRKEFDILLSRFNLDMKDSMALSAAVENRLDWQAAPPSPSEPRLEFDTQLAAWNRFQADPSGFRQTPATVFTTHGIGNDSTTLLSSTGTSDEDHSSSSFSRWESTDSSGSHPSSSSTSNSNNHNGHQNHPYHQSHHAHSPHLKEKPRAVAVTETAVRSSSSHEHSKTTAAHSSTAQLSFLDLPDEPSRPAPSERQCRTFRVMVAWKA